LHRKYVRKRLFYKKEKKLAKNVGVKGENLNILGEETIFGVDD